MKIIWFHSSKELRQNVGLKKSFRVNFISSFDEKPFEKLYTSFKLPQNVLKVLEQEAILYYGNLVFLKKKQS